MEWRGLLQARVPATVLTLALLGIGVVLERLDDERRALEERAAVQRQLDERRDRLHAQIYGDLQLVRGLASVMTLAPDLDQQRFERAVAPLLDERTHLRNVAAAPDMVVRLVTPLAGNEAVLGLDYRSTPGQTEAAYLARDSRRVVLAGPLKLVQGGVGLVARMPVFVDAGGQERFWGLVSAVIDTGRLFADAGLTDPALPVALALRRKGEAAVFFGDAAVFERRPLLAEIALPQATWQMAAVPRGGWSRPAGNPWPLRLGYGATALLVLATFGVLVRSLRQVSAAREQAEAARRQIDALLEGAPDAMLLVDDEGRIVRANSQAAQLFGWQRGGLEGRSVDTLVPAQHRERHREQRRAFAAQPRPDGPVHTRAMVGLRADGSTFPLEILISPLRVDGRDMVAASIRDITLRKAVEEELERHRNRLEELVTQRTAQLAQAKEAAEGANQAKTRFLANLSHEIRTPLNAISGMAYLIRQSGVAADQRERLDTMEAATRHLLEVINAILDLSKIESGRIELAREAVDPAALLRTVAALVREDAAAQGLELVVAPPPPLPPLLGDATQLRQALLNYAANAVRFTARGRVTLALQVVEREAARLCLRFEVADTGEGIDPETLERLFRPFEQGDNTLSRRHGGTGLGLVITRRLAQLMGGEAGVASRLGEGSRFWFTAWLEVGTAAASAGGPRPAPPKAARRVLLVEDDAVNRLIAQHLVQALGHRVELAEDGRQALERVQREDFDLVLMDLQMPVMDGLEATRRIRALPGRERLPIVAITANAFERDRRACLEAGMSDVITKPIDPQRLHEVLQACAPASP